MSTESPRSGRRTILTGPDGRSRRLLRSRWLFLTVGVLFILTGIGPAAAQEGPIVPRPPGVGDPNGGARTGTSTTGDGSGTSVLSATVGEGVDPSGPIVPSLTPGTEGTNPSVLQIDLTGADGEGGTSQPLTIVLVLTVIALAPAMLILLTSFTRIVIVLGITRNALSLQGVPPNQVLIGLALFLTLFVMAPVLTDVNENALQPFLEGEITQSEAFDEGMKPFRAFMLEETREKDIGLFLKLSGAEQPSDPGDIATTTLIPAFVISELRAAFLIGFIIFIPFLVIDMVTSATLMSMGMVMLPPVIISLPFKLLLFVVVDGWFLMVQSLVRSFGTT